LPGAIGEEPHRCRDRLLSRAIGRQNRQRRQPEPHLARQSDGLTAGGQHAHIVDGGQQCLAQLGHRSEHVLAVVQHQQDLLAAQDGHQRLSDRSAGILRDSQPGRDRRRDLARIPDGGQLHQPGPVGEPRSHRPRHLGYLIVPADETGQSGHKSAHYAWRTRGTPPQGERTAACTFLTFGAAWVILAQQPRPWEEVPAAREVQARGRSRSSQPR
jgi:hypothetical protein